MPRGHPRGLQNTPSPSTFFVRIRADAISNVFFAGVRPFTLLA